MTLVGLVWETRPLRTLAASLLLGTFAASALADDPPPKPTVRFDRVVIDDAFPDAYQVEVVDVDGDKKPDIVALGGSTIAWYQNPNWTKRVIATGGEPLAGDIISSATIDLDGDGKGEIAIACKFAMNTPTRGKLFLASQGATLDDPWTLRHVADVPSIHRLRWGDIDGDDKPELIVAPIFGSESQPPTYDQDLARVVEFRPDPEQPKTGKWTEREIMRRPVVHAVKVLPAVAVGSAKQPGGIVTADNTGVSIATAVLDQAGKVSRWKVLPGSLMPGASGNPPKRGSSEIQIGQLPNHQPFFATIDPWHGSEVVVWQPPTLETDLFKAFLKGVVGGLPSFTFSRTVIDSTLDDGHALWTADVDGDGTDEIFAGHRGKDHRVAMYKLDGKTWNRTILDTGIAPQDLRGGDIDGDGVPDVVAVGGDTHNVIWYRPIRLEPQGVAR